MSSQHEQLRDLIAHISQQVPGVGNTIAGAIASYFDTLEDFLSATKKDLSNIKSIRGNQILNNTQILTLHSIIQSLPKNKKIRDLWVTVLVSDFIDSALNNLAEIHFDNLQLNPLLVRALDMRTADQVLEFFLYQSVSRSIVTSWGMRVQEILIRSGADPIAKNDPGGFDIKKTINGIINFIQIKSGTNTMNVDMIRYLNQKLEELESRHPAAKGMLGLTYGTRKQVSAQIMRNLDDPEQRLRVGEELWEFISGEKGYFFNVLEILAESSHKKLKISFSDMIDEKYNEIKSDWKKRYSGFDNNSVDRFLSDYLGITTKQAEKLDEE